MAIAIKSISEAAAKWFARASVAEPDYRKGVATPRRNQNEAAIAADDTWKAAMTAAIARGARVAGLREAGEEKWKRGALEKGAIRFGPGVGVSQPIYQAKTAKYFDAIASLTLTPRGPNNDPRNYQRVPAVGNRLHDIKMGK